MASAGGASGVTDGWVDPLTHLQNSLMREFKQISEEYARLTSECASLRTQQVDLQASSSALREQQAVLSSEVSDLLQQRAAAKKDLEEEQKALDWWRKKEETISIGRRSADVSGRMARTAWLAEARCRTLEAELKDIHASHELDMEGERGIAAGLRDRIGRLEARLRAKEDELKAAKDREKEAGKQAEQGSETRTRDMDRLQAEAGDLKAALKEERRLKGEKEKEVQRLTEAWRDALEENRRQKADTMLSSSRALTPIQQNVPRPRTPPRNSTALYPKSPTPQTPKSLARAYAYLQTRHSESQAQNAHFAEQLLKAQSALKEVHDLHKADKERFLEWRKVEEERSKVRKRKREEKRRERSQVTGVGSSAEPGPDGLVGGGKRRKSEGGRVMVEAPDESAPIVSRRTEKIAEAEVAEAARTSQTIQEDGRDVDRSDLPEEEEEEEEQEYFSPPDVIAPAQVNVIQEPLSMGTMQRLEQASPEKGARPPASSVQHNTSIVTAQTTERQAPIQELYRGRSPAPLRGEVDVDADRSYPTHIASAHNLRASTSRTTRLDRNPPTTRRTSTTPSRSPPRQISRRSTSPHKTPQTTAHVPARTTPWLGGGNLVRTSSKSVLTYTDPFDLSPPEASSAVPGPSRLPANTSKDGNTHHTKPSLIRDRGGTSLRKTALTRFPSDVSYTDSPRSRLLGGTDSLVLEGLSPAEKARKLKQLNKLSTSEKREVYRGYKKDGGRYLPLEQVKRPVTDEYEIDPTKNEGRAHAFHDVKRRKEERKCMHGGDCEECQDWYAAIGPVPRYNQAPKWSDQSRHDEGDEEAIRQHQNMVSRHRETWVKPPTPPGFWSIGFPTTQDVEAQNRRADVMEREKEERIIKEAATSNSKWRKKDR